MSGGALAAKSYNDPRMDFDRFMINEMGGDADAKHYLGLLYLKGEVLPKDDKRALYWIQKAAEQGESKAQFNLAMMHANGKGTPRNDKQALYWYTKAAKQGYGSAQTNLGIMYALGKTADPNLIYAYMWLSLGEASGGSNAQALDVLKNKMSPSNIQEAQALASTCFISSYQDCP